MLLVRWVILVALSAQKINAIHVSLKCGPCRCSFTTAGNVTADCSGKDLTEVPTAIPSNVASLDISNNSFTSLKNKPFKRFSNLVSLRISKNAIRALATDSFYGLSHLISLDLSDNSLTLKPQTYPRGIFRHLIQLRILKLNHNSNTNGAGLCYPDKELGHLTSLQDLYIDGLSNPYFGPGFLKLTNLTKLVLSGNDCECLIETVSDITFENLQNLQFLDISKCSISNISKFAFMPLSKLEVLNLSENSLLGFDIMGCSLYGLQHSSLRILKINALYSPYAVGVILKEKHTIYLKNTSLEEWHIDYNSIESMERRVIENMPRTLKLVSAKGNRFRLGQYWFDFGSLLNVKSVDLSQLFGGTAMAPALSSDKSDKPDSKPQTGESMPGRVIYHLPPNIEFLNLSHCSVNSKLGSLSYPNSSLKILDWSFNVLHKWIGPITGFRLDSLDLSHNSCDFISKYFFKAMSSLKTLNISSNFLSFVLRYDKAGAIFRHLKNLEIFDLSGNKLTLLPPLTFHQMRRLRRLNLNRNFLQKWDPGLSGMNNLTDLDLSHNHFEDLPLEFTGFLDKLANHHDISVNLFGNKLRCNCSNLNFLKWMLGTNVILKLRDRYTCEHANGSVISLSNLKRVVSELERNCFPYVGLVIGVLALILFFTGIAITAIIYRYRWKLRYLYYVAKNKYQQCPPDGQQQFVYDAFISYADEDRGFVVGELRQKLEEQEGLHLCIHHRDFLVGDDIASNITNAVEDSRKTVVLLSSNFLQSYWCKYEVQMAKMESIYTGRNTLLIIVFEEVPLKDISAEIIEVMRSDSYVEYSKDEEGNKVFWRSLIRAIKG